jgi:hypothetical protein
MKHRPSLTVSRGLLSCTHHKDVPRAGPSYPVFPLRGFKTPRPAWLRSVWLTGSDKWHWPARSGVFVHRSRFRGTHLGRPETSRSGNGAGCRATGCTGPSSRRMRCPRGTSARTPKWIAVYVTLTDPATVHGDSLRLRAADWALSFPAGAACTTRFFHTTSQVRACRHIFKFGRSRRRRSSVLRNAQL